MYKIVNIGGLKEIRLINDPKGNNKFKNACYYTPSKLNGYQEYLWEKNPEIGNQTGSYDYMDVKKDGIGMWQDSKPEEREVYNKKTREHNSLRELEYKKLKCYFPRKSLSQLKKEYQEEDESS